MLRVMQVAFALFADAANLSQEGKLNVLGVFDALQVGSLPAVHPRAHLVVHLKGTPTDVIEKLNAEVNAALADAAIKAKVVELGNEPVAMSAAGFSQLIGSEVDKWAKVIKTAGIEQL